ncbi:MAG: hypothetical protein V1846_05330 [Candidatus Komeilibacteria bacterium]
MGKSVVEIRQLDKFDRAFEAVGGTPADFDKMSQADLLRQLLGVVRGKAVVAKIVIDLAKDPFCPNSGTVEPGDHQRGDANFEWDPDMVALYLDEVQMGGRFINGYKLREKLIGKHVFNANALDYLLANSYLIPREWKGRRIFFWGTIYRNSRGVQHVRYLYWGSDGQWDSGYQSLDIDVDPFSPALVLVA